MIIDMATKADGYYAIAFDSARLEKIRAAGEIAMRTQTNGNSQVYSAVLLARRRNCAAGGNTASIRNGWYHICCICKKPIFTDAY